MPTYEYLCEKCGLQFDLFQPITAESIAVCPKEKCAQKRWGRGRVKRQVSAGAGLLFKGTGFYITDYRSEGYKAAAKKDAAGGGESKGAAGGGDSKGAAAGGDKGAGASEAKPTAKTESKAESKSDKSAKPAKAKTGS